MLKIDHVDSKADIALPWFQLWTFHDIKRTEMNLSLAQKPSANMHFLPQVNIAKDSPPMIEMYNAVIFLYLHSRVISNEKSSLVSALQGLICSSNWEAE